MKILVACEYSGRVRDAFSARGHDAWSCDLLPTESPGNHYQGDVLDILYEGWDMLIGHPPCTRLAVSGAAWFNRPGNREKQLEAGDVSRGLMITTLFKPLEFEGFKVAGDVSRGLVITTGIRNTP